MVAMELTLKVIEAVEISGVIRKVGNETFNSTDEQSIQLITTSWLMGKPAGDSM